MPTDHAGKGGLSRSMATAHGAQTANRQAADRVPFPRVVSVPTLLPQRQLCAWIGKSEAWAERGRLEGYGPPYIKVGRSVRYIVEDVLNWLEENRRRSTSDGSDAA